MKIPFFSKNKPRTDSFSEFFRHASREEKEHMFREVAKEANADQQKVLEEYDQKIQVLNAR